MSTKLIRSLFESRLKAWADARSPALKIAFQNVPFTPPAETYLRAFVLPAKTGSEDLEGTHRLYRGLLQVSIVLPAGMGTGAAGGIVSEIDALFPLNLRLTSGSFSVFIRSPMSDAAGIQEPDRWVVPVTAQYRADTI